MHYEQTCNETFRSRISILSKFFHRLSFHQISKYFHECVVERIRYHIISKFPIAQNNGKYQPEFTGSKTLDVVILQTLRRSYSNNIHLLSSKSFSVEISADWIFLPLYVFVSQQLDFDHCGGSSCNLLRYINICCLFGKLLSYKYT